MKSKWRNLRDTFRRELAKAQSFRSGAAGDSTKKSKWAYFELMLFIKDTFTAKPTTSNVPSNAEENDEGNYDKNSENDEESLDEDQSDKGEPIDKSATQQNDVFRTPAAEKMIAEHRDKLQKKRKGSENVYEQLIDIEKKKLETYNAKTNLANDSDYHFLMSLLPQMKALPPVRNMQMRLNIQQLFLTDHYQNTPQTQNTPQYTVATSLSSPCDTHSLSSTEQVYSPPSTIDNNLQFTVPGSLNMPLPQQPSSFNQETQNAARFFHTFK